MIEVLASGLYSSIQDLGRIGYRNIGVPVSGVMDGLSAQLANALLNNSDTCAVLEMTYQGATLRFHKATYIAISGAQCSMTLNGQLCKNNAVITVAKHDILHVGSMTVGVRAYLAVAGGFDAPKVLGSQSFYKGITACDRITKGDYLAHADCSATIVNRSSLKIDPLHFFQTHLLVNRGPDFDLLSDFTRNQIFSLAFEVSSQSNRMAYQLLNQKFKVPAQVAEIISAGVLPGTVQLTPSGQLMVLMRDAQTTGGYARILQLTDRAIHQIAQTRPGTLLYFRMV